MPKSDKGAFGAAAFVAIFHATYPDRLLCVKHSYRLRKWSLPGGGLTQGESWMHAAHAETREETGLEISGLRAIGVYDQQWTNDEDITVDIKLVLFRARSYRGVLLTSTDETEDAGFFSIDTLPDLYEGQKQLALAAFTRKKLPGLRCLPLAQDS